ASAAGLLPMREGAPGGATLRPPLEREGEPPQSVLPPPGRPHRIRDRLALDWLKRQCPPASRWRRHAVLQPTKAWRRPHRRADWKGSFSQPAEPDQELESADAPAAPTPSATGRSCSLDGVFELRFQMRPRQV